MTASKLRCFTECAEDDACKSMNICPSASNPRLAECHMLDDYSKWYCKQLTNDPKYSQCFHAEKTTKCMNGGRLLSNDTCRCDVCFKGDVCQYHVQDCMEAHNLVKLVGGYSDDIRCNIQPANAPRPFMVKCSPQYGFTTFLVRVQGPAGWSQIDWASQLWESYSRGFGSFDKLNYFAGLENLHYLLSQADYRLVVFNIFHDWLGSEAACTPAYMKPMIAPENADFAFNYTLHTICNGTERPGLNGFYAANTTHRFCSKDRDCGTCARDHGPGWYHINGTTCYGYSPFAPVAKWPYFDQGDLIIKETHHFLERVSDYY
ncbi:hypothetical protein BaRGS_00003668 [Batillaria attramentaria]|uniref:Fibrinogen C-terminal domain-containing protein n=1 Tax=Batillaria attramentaria TaxID=370345 RepID=A0ABD0M1C7_9CAEN